MKIYKMKDMTGGWFVGDFEPSAIKTKEFEVCYKCHAKGEQWPTHYHKVATEISFVISGKMTIQGQLLQEGDIFVLEPNEVADPVFLEDCCLVVVKTPSVIGDKYEVE